MVGLKTRGKSINSITFVAQIPFRIHRSLPRLALDEVKWLTLRAPERSVDVHSCFTWKVGFLLLLSWVPCVTCLYADHSARCCAACDFVGLVVVQAGRVPQNRKIGLQIVIRPNSTMHGLICLCDLREHASESLSETSLAFGRHKCTIGIASLVWSASHCTKSSRNGCTNAQKDPVNAYGRTLAI